MMGGPATAFYFVISVKGGSGEKNVGTCDEILRLCS